MGAGVGVGAGAGLSFLQLFKNNSTPDTRNKSLPEPAIILF
jgi:hypothetical protein